ncbi:hypothetical protein K8Z61_05050 [Nocardioides sp. TRM66260-LWL]|uniref:hypothetical protein n=1 Tax=Nocardioides sp. TRM66260-LWL TaxID=2874478 RepID=UPI001CC3F131|nr:hypothetical protein [Nocardioides sp. TRM66260-LWL]MBZ5733855.1 hypothetical protein [Nocardioides sp. TRM66260-LWL]
MNAAIIDLSQIRTRAALIDAGLTDGHIRKAVQRGNLVRVRHGAYVEGELWRRISSTDQHRLRARAVLLNAGTRVVLSHVSAALEHGASGWGLSLADVHITRLDGRTGRREAGVAQHRGELGDASMTVADVAVTSPARCVAELLGPGTGEACLVLAHELIRRGLTTAGAIDAGLATTGRWPGALSHPGFRRLLGEPCESVAESRFLHLVRRAGLPMPVIQMAIHDEGGRMVARLDAAWPDLGVFVEVDGRIKYDLPFGDADPGLVLWREKRREDEVRRITGWRCLRVTWADLERPERLIGLLRSLLGSRAA